MPRRSSTAQAIVADAGTRQALVALREIAKSGVAVAALDSDPHAPGLASRWCAAKALVPDFVKDPHAYVDAVLRVCDEHGASSLIPAHDGSIEALRARREEVERTVGLAMAPEHALAAAVDKTLTLSFAQTIGLRIPRGVFVLDKANAEAALDEVGLPLVVKPTRSWAQEEGVGQRLIAEVVTTRAAALVAMGQILDEGVEVVLQEWLSGDREALSFFRAQGRTWARFAQRADRTFPPLGGNSVLRESIPMPADVSEGAERLVAELGLDGYSEVEFRRDANGVAALMEINPRLSASVEIAVRAGVPFPRLLHDWASGAELHAAGDYRKGLRMRWLGGDLSWLRCVLGQRPGPDVPSRGRALRTFAFDFARPLSYDYADRHDPRPGLVAATGAMRRMSQLAQHDTPQGGTSGAPKTARAGELDTEVVVIGAGPYGLSVSAQLSGRGVRHEVFGKTMDLWATHMPAGMYLKSEGFASNLSDPAGEHTLERYCAEAGIGYGEVAVPIANETFKGYGHWFQQRAVPHLRDEWIEQVSKLPGGYEVRLSDGQTLRCKGVVVASGMTNCAYVPPELQSLSQRTLTHCYEHRDPSESRGMDVVVIGAGQSALESAALMHEQGANVRVLVRGSKLQWNTKPGPKTLGEKWREPRSGLGDARGLWVYANLPLGFYHAPMHQKLKRAYKVLGPAGAWWLRERIEGKFEVLLDTAVVGAREDNGGARLQLRGPSGSESELATSHVFAGTGYRADVNLLPFFDPAMRGQIATVPQTPNTPALDSHFQSSLDHLYFVGYMAGMNFGPVMRFVYGAEFAANRVARRVAR